MTSEPLIQPYVRLLVTKGPDLAATVLADLNGDGVSSQHTEFSLGDPDGLDADSTRVIKMVLHIDGGPTGDAAVSRIARALRSRGVWIMVQRDHQSLPTWFRLLPNHVPRGVSWELARNGLRSDRWVWPVEVLVEAAGYGPLRRLDSFTLPAGASTRDLPPVLGDVPADPIIEITPSAPWSTQGGSALVSIASWDGVIAAGDPSPTWNAAAVAVPAETTGTVATNTVTGTKITLAPNTAVPPGRYRLIVQMTGNIPQTVRVGTRTQSGVAIPGNVVRLWSPEPGAWGGGGYTVNGWWKSFSLGSISVPSGVDPATVREALIPSTIVIEATLAITILSVGLIPISLGTIDETRTLALQWRGDSPSPTRALVIDGTRRTVTMRDSATGYTLATDPPLMLGPPPQLDPTSANRFILGQGIDGGPMTTSSAQVVIYYYPRVHHLSVGGV